jgi:hypothetical protein
VLWGLPAGRPLEDAGLPETKAWRLPREAFRAPARATGIIIIDDVVWPRRLQLCRRDGIPSMSRRTMACVCVCRALPLSFIEKGGAARCSRPASSECDGGLVGRRGSPSARLSRRRLCRPRFGGERTPAAAVVPPFRSGVRSVGPFCSLTAHHRHAPPSPLHLSETNGAWKIIQPITLGPLGRFVVKPQRRTRDGGMD